jgi:hypothetical protein
MSSKNKKGSKKPPVEKTEEKLEGNPNSAPDPTNVAPTVDKNEEKGENEEPGELNQEAEGVEKTTDDAKGTKKKGIYL